MYMDILFDIIFFDFDINVKGGVCYPLKNVGINVKFQGSVIKGSHFEHVGFYVVASYIG